MAGAPERDSRNAEGDCLYAAVLAFSRAVQTVQDQSSKIGEMKTQIAILQQRRLRLDEELSAHLAEIKVC